MITLYSENYKDRLINIGKQYDQNFETKFLVDNYKIYLYVEEDEIVGFLITEETIDESNIVLLYVDKNSRRQKIASYLLDYFISDKTFSKERILLEVSSNNQAAINLYDKFGFKTINVRKKYYKDGSDALIMERMVLHE